MSDKELIQQLRDLANLRHDDLSIGDEAADALERLTDANKSLCENLVEQQNKISTLKAELADVRTSADEFSFRSIAEYNTLKSECLENARQDAEIIASGAREIERLTAELAEMELEANKNLKAWNEADRQRSALKAELAEVRVERNTLQRCYMDYKAELAALKAQSEPVGYANADELDNMLDDRAATIVGVKDGWRSTALYTTPQPAQDKDAELINKLLSALQNLKAIYPGESSFGSGAKASYSTQLKVFHEVNAAIDAAMQKGE